MVPSTSTRCGQREVAPDMMMNLDRRSFLKTIPTGLLGAQKAVRTPWSSGTEPPQTKAPANTADCHHHIYDPRFPIAKSATLRPEPATVADYRLLQKRLGSTRNVIVQPSTYGMDNGCLLDALRQFGTLNTRGIAVVSEQVSEAQLRKLNKAGVRGIRFNLLQPGAASLDMLELLSKRVAQLGWHVEINASSGQIVAASRLFARLHCPIVFDHFGHTLLSGRNDPAFSIIAKQLHSGNGWLKLSGAYIDSKVGPPTYPESTPTAQAYVAEAPDQLVWGTDWPHPTTAEKPDDAILFDLLARWVPDVSTRHRILVENPARLYGFI